MKIRLEDIRLEAERKYEDIGVTQETDDEHSRM